MKLIITRIVTYYSNNALNTWMLIELSYLKNDINFSLFLILFVDLKNDQHGTENFQNTRIGFRKDPKK